MTVFKYKEELTGDGQKTISRPIADVWVKTSGNLWLEFHPYIDSGADFTMIPLSLGRLIGFKVDNNKIKKIGGIQGSVPVIFVKNKIKIGSLEIDACLAWCQIENVPPLLGRTDIFDTFDVTFKQNEKKILFQSN